MALRPRTPRSLSGRAAAFAAALLVAGAVAAAASEHLPDQAQDPLGQAEEHADGQAELSDLPDEAGGDAELPQQAGGDPDLPDEANGGHGDNDSDGSESADGQVSTQSEGRDGQEVSAAVHEAIDSTEPGLERGQAVSEAASDGRSGAGDAQGDQTAAGNAPSGDDGSGGTTAEDAAAEGRSHNPNG